MNKRMKITPGDYKELSTDIRQFLNDNPDANWESAEKIGWSFVRYCWEIYHQVNNRDNNFKYNRSLYDYLNDNHITTALKSIITTIEKEIKK